MPEHRMTMHKAREILRLKWSQGLSNREVGRSVKASPATVSNCLMRAKAAGLSWPLPEAVDDAALEGLLYPRKGSRKDRPEPDFKHIYRELKRKGVTLELLWMEYKAVLHEPAHHLAHIPRAELGGVHQLGLEPPPQGLHQHGPAETGRLRRKNGGGPARRGEAVGVALHQDTEARPPDVGVAGQV